MFFTKNPSFFNVRIPAPPRSAAPRRQAAATGCPRSGPSARPRPDTGPAPQQLRCGGRCAPRLRSRQPGDQKLQRMPAVQRTHRQQVEGAQGQVCPGGGPGSQPGQQQAAGEIRRRPRQRHRKFRRVGQMCRIGPQLRSEDGDPHSRSPASRRYSASRWPVSWRRAAERITIRISISRSPERTTRSAAESRRTPLPPHARET